MDDVINRLRHDSPPWPTAQVVWSASAAPPISRWQFVALMQVAEAVTIMTCSLAALAIARARDATAEPGIVTCLVAAGLLTVIVQCVFNSMRAHEFDEILQYAPSLGAAAWCLAAGPLLMLGSFHNPHGEYARVWILTWFISGMIGLITLRWIAGKVARWLQHRKLLGHAICIVGSGQEAERCIEQARVDRTGLQVLGYFDFQPTEDLRSPRLIDAPYLGEAAGLATYLKFTRVDEIVITKTAGQEDTIAQLVLALQSLPVRISLSEGCAGIPFTCLPKGHSKIGGIKLLPVVGKPLDGWCWIFKDVQDRFLASLILILVLPVMTAIAVGIRISSPGDILFRQEREGYGGRKFRIFKFRTMRSEPVSTGAGELKLTVRNDPRIFPLGALLRKTSLDELPQLLNVLRGDMWLIGPRPHTPLARVANLSYLDAVEAYAARHRIKPGITGWAQVNGWRGPTETVNQVEQRVAYDLYYIDNWSLLLDAKILIMTLLHGFVNQNAF